MRTVYLFDVDGTLTPSRGTIQEDFRLWMVDFCEKHPCSLVTGSDQSKTIEQIGEYLYNKFDYQFQCNGNNIYSGKDKEVWRSDWTLPDKCREWLQRALNMSSFRLRTGKHIEERSGMVNFSIVGRNANFKERQEYIKHDEEEDERHRLAERFNVIFGSNGIQAQVGGETGLDITPVGSDKSKVVNWLRHNDVLPPDRFVFFGDACHKGGNDYPLAREIQEKNIGTVYNIDNWKETWNILKEIS